MRARAEAPWRPANRVTCDLGQVRDAPEPAHPCPPAPVGTGEFRYVRLLTSTRTPAPIVELTAAFWT